MPKYIFQNGYILVDETVYSPIVIPPQPNTCAVIIILSNAKKPDDSVLKSMEKPNVENDEGET